MHGLLQVVSLMLALGGAGIDKDRSPPSADAILAYDIVDADAMVYVDLAAIAPRNYKVLIGLPDDAGIKASPDLYAAAKQIKANAEGIRAVSKAALGFDPVNDLTSATLYYDVSGERLLVLRGTFPKDFVAKLTKLAGGTAGTIDGRATMELDGNTFVGTAKGGALLVGTKAWVTARVADDWAPPARKKGSAAALIAKSLDEHPFALVAAHVDSGRAASLDGALGDLASSAELAIVALHSDGVRLYWKDRTKEHLARMSLAIDGTIELLRAAHMAPRGLAELLAGTLDGYAGQGADVDQLIAHKDDLVQAIDDNTGDGNFKAKVDTDKKARTITVKATADTFSQVVPAAVLLPAVAALLL